MSDTNPKSSMTLPEILARLERMEKEASGLVIPEPIGPTCKQFSEEARLDALALSEARKALASDVEEEDVWTIRVFREDDGRFAAEYRSGDKREGGMGNYSVTPLGALAELIATLIKVEEDRFRYPDPTPPPQEP